MTRLSLILLPGLGSDGALWAEQVADLADIADPVVGDTLHDDTLPAMAARILAAAPQRFALAGLSMGGYLALEIMRQAPDRVRCLALCDTSARADTPEQTAGRNAAIDAAGKYDFAALARTSVGQLVAAAAAEQVRDAVVTMSVRVGVAAYVRHQRAIMQRPDSRPLLPSIAVPTLVMVGAEDALTPPPLAEEMAEAIPAATLRIVPAAGHLPPMERPAETTAILRDWLAAA